MNEADKYFAELQANLDRGVADARKEIDMTRIPTYRELINVLQNAATVRSISLTEKRIDVLVEALQIADAATRRKEASMSEETTIGVPVVLAIPHQRFADLLTTAIETPAGDWLRKVTIASDLTEAARRLDRNMPWYSFGALLARPDFQMVVRYDKATDSDPGQKTLTMQDFQQALILMATKDSGAYARHFSDFMGENDDANTADLFMQFAVFGEEVYG